MYAVQVACIGHIPSRGSAAIPSVDVVDISIDECRTCISCDWRCGRISFSSSFSSWGAGWAWCGMWMVRRGAAYCVICNIRYWGVGASGCGLQGRRGKQLRTRGTKNGLPKPNTPYVGGQARHLVGGMARNTLWGHHNQQRRKTLQGHERHVKRSAVAPIPNTFWDH